MFELTNLQKRSSPPPAEDPGELRSFPPLGSAIKVLMIWPKIPPSFWSFQGMMSLVPEKTTMPPLGLITVAALCPKNWTIRLIDRAFDELLDADLAQLGDSQPASFEPSAELRHLPKRVDRRQRRIAALKQLGPIRIRKRSDRT